MIEKGVPKKWEHLFLICIYRFYKIQQSNQQTPLNKSDNLWQKYYYTDNYRSYGTH